MVTKTDCDKLGHCDSCCLPYQELHAITNQFGVRGVLWYCKYCKRRLVEIPRTQKPLLEYLN